MTPCRFSHLAMYRRPGSLSDGTSCSAADQRDGVSLLGEFGGRLGTGQPGADHGDRSVGAQLVERGAQLLRVLQFTLWDKRIRLHPVPTHGATPVLPTA